MTIVDSPSEARTGRAPLRFAERSFLGLLVVVAIGLGFGVLLLLVRFRWEPLLSVDRGIAQDLNTYVAAHPAVVEVLTVISRLGSRAVMF